MRKNGGRENQIPMSREGDSSITGIPNPPLLSSSKLGDADSEILSLASGCPITLISVSRKMDIPFVECLSRAKKLEEMGLLERLEGPSRPGGLLLYLATRGKL
ncbi:MAG: hypothetical protein KAR39_10350 [Thermoplasmata archaeon]|nr:hypothetical protein [Thermoplasmata archaeon]